MFSATGSRLVPSRDSRSLWGRQTYGRTCGRCFITHANNFSALLLLLNFF
jgi:hypothetical protein